MGFLPRDDNRNLLRWEDGQIEVKEMTFAGGTTDDPGDFNGAGNPATLFNVTGVVAMRLFAICGTDLAGASATVSVGTTNAAAALIAQTTATNIDVNEIWHDASPDASVEAISVATEKIVADDVIQTVGTANITAGQLTYYCLWRPISPDGNVSAA